MSTEQMSTRLRAVYRGAVQGVGFRPFLYRLATELKLRGWVANTPDGAIVEVEGPAPIAEEFLIRSQREHPPHASIQSLEATHLDPVGYERFEIRHSVQEGARRAFILPDIATCEDCLRELRDTSDRRYGYPFINCTNCGPRYSIILRLPYDRPHTTMERFRMCPDCQAEYEDPLDRRFHAQPNACPVCGPHLELWDSEGVIVAGSADAITTAAEAILAGSIVAVKGLGGFHLVVDATNPEAVARLRMRKRREEKPLALMCPELAYVRQVCNVSPLEERLLTGPERPIVLLRKTEEAEDRLAANVAPGNPQLGIMLPYTPLHHLLMDRVARPIVATSGNISDEPICTDEHEALHRLRGVADLFLVHNRPIARHVDDSIVRVILGREQVLRRARGYAPLPVTLPAVCPVTAAVGPHLKASVALAVGTSVYISQHIGDLDTTPARRAHARVIRDLCSLYEQPPAVIAADLHPDYASTTEAYRLADEIGAVHPRPSVEPVQHHYAHVLSCMADNGLDGAPLGVSWDGTGLGADGTIWGGEFLMPTADGFRRVGHLRPFRLPGGDVAAREPRRAAAGVLYAILGNEAPRIALNLFAGEHAAWLRMMEAGVNSPWTTSAGRLFDAIAAITNVRTISRFEGQAAMELEWCIRSNVAPASYSLEIAATDAEIVLDWEGMVRDVLEDVRSGVSVAAIARGFHEALVAGILNVARSVGEPNVVLSGGCFQNRYLTERTVESLQQAGFRVYWHQRVPPNDGGIALGQAYAVARRIRKEDHGCVSPYPGG